MWRWQRDTELQGYVLAFEEEFLLSFFNDRSFLQKIPYLQRNRRSPFYFIGGSLYDRLCLVMEQIKAEIHGTESDLRRTSLHEIDRHILRAMLYETLTLFKRSEALTISEEDYISAKRYMEPFIRSVEKHFAMRRNVTCYASLLCITPNYLNKIVKQQLGMSAKEYINRHCAGNQEPVGLHNAFRD